MKKFVALVTLLLAAPAALGQAGQAYGYNVGGKPPILPWQEAAQAEAAKPVDARVSTTDVTAVRIGEEPPPTPASVGGQIDALDARVRAGLDDLGKLVFQLEVDSKGWEKLDKSVKTARAVNAALMKKSADMLKVYDEKIGPALKDLGSKLKDAPAVYRAMATDRRAKAAAATIAPEQRGYTAQAEFCEAAAVLCERRHKEVFTSSDPKKLSEADALAEAMAQVRKMAAVHQGWDEVLASWPSTLNDPKLADMIEQLHRYSTDLVEQQQLLVRLTAALKTTAAEGKK